MSGYTGNPDAEAEHALVINENGIEAARSMLRGPVEANCRDCHDPIPSERVQFARDHNIRCLYCVPCQRHHDKAPRTKMLDRIL